MPGPIRRPLAHPVRTPVISPAAVRLFDAMRRIKCTCASDADDCPGCERFRALGCDLARELRLRPWQYPTVECPDAYCAPDAVPDLEAQARWRMLERASCEARLARRVARKAAAGLNR